MSLKQQRNADIYRMRVRGATFAEIGRKFGLSGGHVQWIVLTVERRQRRQWFALRPIEGCRPIDMGGPRDVWLTFVPGPDPRLDWQVPATAADA